MESGHTPVYAVDTQMLCEPVFQFVPPLTSPSTVSYFGEETMAIRITHSVKILDIVDMFLYVNFLGGGRTATSARTGNQGHINRAAGNRADFNGQELSRCQAGCQSRKWLVTNHKKLLNSRG